MIGGKEVAVEAKEASLLKLNQQFAEETDPDRQQALLEQIAAVEAGIQELYEGTEESEGLYALMAQGGAAGSGARGHRRAVSGGHIRAEGDRAKVR